jgi:hypothetical protein
MDLEHLTRKLNWIAKQETDENSLLEYLLFSVIYLEGNIPVENGK